MFSLILYERDCLKTMASEISSRSLRFSAKKPQDPKTDWLGVVAQNAKCKSNAFYTENEIFDPL
jgi:hypothetical protein